MKFVVIEGIDGAGKTTVAKYLCEYLQQSTQGKVHFVDKKSTDAMTKFQHVFMEQIRPILWDRLSEEPIAEINESSWMYLHLLWYHLVEENVIKKYINCDYIIMDGWFYKFLARNMVNRKNDTEYTKELFRNIRSGDMIFYLSVSPEICYERKICVKPSECGVHQSQGILSEKEGFIQYQKKVAEAYEDLIKQNSMIVIDGQFEIDRVVKSIVKYL